MQYFSSKAFGRKGNPTIFFFTAFLTKYWLYYPTINILTRAGYYVVVYDVHKELILTKDAQDFLSVTQALITDVQRQVSDLKKQGVRGFSVFGSSMGTVPAMRAAIDTPEIKKVIINITYGSLVDNIWSWKFLRKLKHRLVESGMTKAELEKLFEPISPLSMATKLPGKKVLLYLAKNDKVILFEQSRQFKQALDKAKVDYQYYQNNTFGHIIGGYGNLLRSKIYLDFLKR
jgi:hypothetical protein